MLFKNIDEVKKFVPVAATLDFNDLKPEIVDAELYVTRQTIGEEQLSVFQEGYTDNSITPESKVGVAMDFFRKAVINLAVLTYMPKGNITLSQTGTHITTDEHKKAAFQWMTDEFKDALLNTSEKAQDNLLLFLESNKPEFSEWVGSNNYSVFKELFIGTAVEFEEFVPIGQSRAIFIKLKSFMKRSQRNGIDPVLCPDYSRSLLAKIKAGTALTDNEKEVHYLVKSALANLTMAEALPTLSFSLTDKGAFVWAFPSGTITSQRQKISDDKIEALVAQRLANAKSDLADLDAYLKKNALLIPDYQASSCYQASQGVTENPNSTVITDKVVGF